MAEDEEWRCRGRDSHFKIHKGPKNEKHFQRKNDAQKVCKKLLILVLKAVSGGFITGGRAIGRGQNYPNKNKRPIFFAQGPKFVKEIWQPSEERAVRGKEAHVGPRGRKNGIA